jgi:hypothetical protein
MVAIREEEAMLQIVLRIMELMVLEESSSF